MIPIPAWAIKGLVVAGLVVAAYFGFQAYHDSVFNDGATFADNRRAKQDADKKAADTVTARADEKKLSKIKEAEQTARREKDQQYETKIASLEGRVRTGAVSLSIATAAIRAGSAGGNPGPVAGPAEAERTNLMPETAIAFIRIAGDSARDVRDYNALMVEYERARALCNKGS